MLAERSLIEFPLAGDDVLLDAFCDGGSVNLISLELDQERVPQGFRLLQVGKAGALLGHEVPGWGSPLDVNWAITLEVEAAVVARKRLVCTMHRGVWRL